jgi:uncharacterized protein (DUF302 family)
MPEIRQENGTGVAPTPDGGSSMTDISRCIVLDAPFEASVTATLEAFRAEGFDLASTLDLREYLARNVHHDCRRYLLLNLLLPHVTLEALQLNPELGPLVLTTIVIYELPDGEAAVVARPSLAPGLVDDGERAASHVLANLADRAAERLAHALDRLSKVQVAVRNTRRT